MADSELRTKGREMRRKLLGDAAVERIDKSVYNDPIMAKFPKSPRKPSLARCGRGRAWI